MASRNPYTPASYRRENRLAGAKTRFWRVCAAGATEVMSQTGAKRCSRCGENGSSDSFPPNSRMRDGLSSWCRRCHAAAVQRWRERNPAKAASYNLARRVKHEPRPCSECGETVRAGAFGHAGLLGSVGGVGRVARGTRRREARLQQPRAGHRELQEARQGPAAAAGYARTLTHIALASVSKRRPVNQRPLSWIACA
jgi:hypothetical protein